MVIGLFGESCTGKSSVAELLKKQLGAQFYSGKDYLRLAKKTPDAETSFAELLREHVDSDDCIIYVLSEKDQLAMLPEGAFKVLFIADIETIKQRFAQRMHGVLPAPAAQMLERKHGAFDSEPCDMHVTSTGVSAEEICESILVRLAGM